MRLIARLLPGNVPSTVGIRLPDDHSADSRSLLLRYAWPRATTWKQLAPLASPF